MFRVIFLITRIFPVEDRKVSPCVANIFSDKKKDQRNHRQGTSDYRKRCSKEKAGPLLTLPSIFLIP